MTYTRLPKTRKCNTLGFLALHASWSITFFTLLVELRFDKYTTSNNLGPKYFRHLFLLQNASCHVKNGSILPLKKKKPFCYGDFGTVNGQ